LEQLKRVVYLTFYFQPDLCAGSFRNSPLAIELAKLSKERNIVVDLYTTMPNRYSTFESNASEFEQLDNLFIHRVSLPPHKSGMMDQVLSFRRFYSEVLRLNKNKKADLVFASSSRLFTAYLGFKLSNSFKAPLYLDIRDIFVDTMNDVFKSRILKWALLPLLKLIESKTFGHANHINLISGGFRQYFSKFNQANFSFFTNGIDDEFLTNLSTISSDDGVKKRKTIVYAGNIGEGQGLHKIIPGVAKSLKNDFQFLVIGDGGVKKLLQDEIIRLNLDNVELKNPVNRVELRKIYAGSDYLFIHLNDYPAFRKVLPSKVFELATFNRPILAGVSGFAAEFIENEVSDSFVFDPCNVDQLVNFLKSEYLPRIIDRKDFKIKYQRGNINKLMAESIISYI
jgi:glycosyltransferase involved in cell wall biosynthesis